MKIKTKIFLSFVLSLPFGEGWGGASAQQLQLNNQYLVNKFSLSPAYTGASDNELFMSYRKNWAGISGAPEMANVSANGSINRNMGVGINAGSQQQGIFRNAFASLNYAYNIDITDMQSIRFGVSGGFINNYINLSGSKSQSVGDPVVAVNQNINKTTFDVNTAILYRFQNFNIGVVVPQILENKVSENSNTIYTAKRHFVAHISYNFNVNESWQIAPLAIARKTLESPLMYEAAALIKYQKQVWLGVTYRKANGMGISAGANAFKNKFIVNYSYEFSSQGLAGNSNGTHEITLGYVISKNKFQNDPKKPYIKWVE